MSSPHSEVFLGIFESQNDLIAPFVELRVLFHALLMVQNVLERDPYALVQRHVGLKIGCESLYFRVVERN